ncbi:hypothetical protein PR001_g10278 [Phytophthora rubi]|uniref:Uncharacterized protein n=1 Tax=Phytophthora rubi TaxID=129364 RepID=A0A6A3MKF6_9STRA|nr:hypothetical protein PR001_g10278 [Phytophthora rubi]
MTKTLSLSAISVTSLTEAASPSDAKMTCETSVRRASSSVTAWLSQRCQGVVSGAIKASEIGWRVQLAAKSAAACSRLVIPCPLTLLATCDVCGEPCGVAAWVPAMNAGRLTSRSPGKRNDK